MGVRQIEFRLHLLVAGETEVNLLGFEKLLPHRGPMNLVAVITGNGAQLVNRSPELKKCFLLHMTLQAAIGPGLCFDPLKGEDHALPFSLGMF